MAVLLWSHRPTRPLAMSSLYMSRNSGVVKDGPCSRPIQRQARQRFLTVRHDQPHRVHPYPRGGSLCTSSGHSLSTTVRTSSEMTVTFSMSSMYLCNRRKSAGVITLPPTIRGE
jgi:hypothetical protein